LNEGSQECEEECNSKAMPNGKRDNGDTDSNNKVTNVNNAFVSINLIPNLIPRGLRFGYFPL
jgi:hypothetical protein